MHHNRRRCDAIFVVDNENNNTLKTQVYRFEHHDGHGKQHLASHLATLILLAFLIHSLLDHADALYQRVRQHLSSRRMFFGHLRTLTLYLVFSTWDELFHFMLDALEKAQPPPKQQLPAVSCADLELLGPRANRCFCL